MQIKTTPSMQALCFTQKTTIPEMMKYVRVVANDLHKYAIENNLEVTGPVYWIYQGMDGNPETIFTLNICLPVSKTSFIPDRFEIKNIPGFHCVSEVIQGSWEQIPQTYHRLMEYATKNQLQILNQSREIYIHMDFSLVENNITEIQLEIK